MSAIETMDAPYEVEGRRLSPGALVAGKYRIERELGAGGVGVVVLATHLELGQRVAIKYLRSGDHANERAIERFRREAKLAASLRSEHVVKVYDVGSLEDGMPFMVMEYLEGEDLAEVLERGPIPVEQAVQWTLEACQALEEAHDLGIIHRDLKPANLFLAKRANRPAIVKIVDFGISKIAESSSLSGLPKMTRQNETFGTPYYMSPEQLVSSTEVDARSDIWAMGVCLYELLTGRLPFENTDLRQLVADVLSSVPSPIRDHRPEIPVELAQIVHACLSYDPEQRPQSVANLARRLGPFASAGYVRQLAFAETEVSGLHDLGWVHAPNSGNAPATDPPVVPVKDHKVYAFIAAGGGLLAGAAMAVVFALTHAHGGPIRAQSLVASEPVPMMSAAVPSAPPSASVATHLEPLPASEVIELPNDAADASASASASAPVAVSIAARTPSPAKPTKAPTPSRASTLDQFGDRK